MISRIKSIKNQTTSQSQGTHGHWRYMEVLKQFLNVVMHWHLFSVFQMCVPY